MADATAHGAPFLARRERERQLTVVLPIVTGAVVLALWQGLVTALHAPDVILPAPSAIAGALVSHAGELASEAWYTAVEAVIACLLAAVLGVIAAAALASSRFVRETLYPYLVAAQFIPKVALAPLFIIWLGIEMPSRLVFATFMSFFPVAIATLAGLMRTSPSSLLLCKSLTAKPWQTMLYVRLPYALPFFFSGMRVAATLAVLGVLVGEFISARHGLGAVILQAAAHADTAVVFAAIAVLCIIGLALFGAVAAAERRFSHQAQ